MMIVMSTDRGNNLCNFLIFTLCPYRNVLRIQTMFIQFDWQYTTYQPTGHKSTSHKEIAVRGCKSREREYSEPGDKH